MEIINSYFFFLFQKVPGSTMDKYLTITLIAFGVILILKSVAFKYIRRKTRNKNIKKITRELPTGLMTFGLIDLFLVWVRLEHIPFFSMRFWWIIFWISFVSWTILKIKKVISIIKRLQKFKQ
jgi:hypothetical protein